MDLIRVGNRLLISHVSSVLKLQLKSNEWRRVESKSRCLPNIYHEPRQLFIPAFLPSSCAAPAKTFIYSAPTAVLSICKFHCPSNWLTESFLTDQSTRYRYRVLVVVDKHSLSHQLRPFNYEISYHSIRSIQFNIWLEWKYLQDYNNNNTRVCFKI